MSQNDKKEIVRRLISKITNSLYFFDKEMLGYSEMCKHAHMQLCEFMDGRYSDNGKEGLSKPFKLVLMPRNSFKTSIVTIGYSLKSIVENPDIRILIANEKFDNAKDFLRELKGHIEYNPKFRAAYGDYTGSKNWTEESITVQGRKKNLKEPTVSCAGIGVVKVGMHYDLIIMDDLVSQANITTKDQMRKVIDFYKLALSLLVPGGKIVVIGTRWSFNDLYNHIIENEMHRFDTFVRSAFADDGSLLFPEVLSRKFLEDQRKSQSSYIFSCQYLNNPVDDDSADFKKEWIRYYTIDNYGFYKPVEQEDEYHRGANITLYTLDQMNCYLTLDPAISQSKYADESGIVICAIDPADRVFVLHAKGYRLSTKQLVDKVFSLCRKYPVKKIGLETAVFQKIIKFEIYRQMKELNQYLPIEELTTTWTTSKEERIIRLQPRFENREIFLTNDMKDLEDQIIRFRVSKRDDILDALAHQLQLLKKPKFRTSSGAPLGSFEYYRQGIKRKSDYVDYIGNQKIGDWRKNSYG